MDSLGSSVVHSLLTKAKGISVRVILYGGDVPVIITGSLLTCSEVTMRLDIHCGKLWLLFLTSAQRVNKIFGRDAVL